MDDQVWTHDGNSVSGGKKQMMILLTNRSSRSPLRRQPLIWPFKFMQKQSLLLFRHCPLKTGDLLHKLQSWTLKNPLLVQSYSCYVWIKWKMLQWAAPLYFHKGLFWTASATDKFAVLGKRINSLKFFCFVFLKKPFKKKKKKTQPSLL